MLKIVVLEIIKLVTFTKLNNENTSVVELNFIFLRLRSDICNEPTLVNLKRDLEIVDMF